MSDDYMQDGLLYCGNCRTPRQLRIEVLGRVQTVPVLCQCRNAQYAENRARMQRENRYWQLCTHPAMAFDLGVQSDVCDARVRRYLDRWPDMLRQNIGLLLWGDVGTGKTASAAYLANRLRQMFVPCLVSSFARLVDVQRPTPRLDDFDLLVLDDLGAERQSAFMLEKVYEIVNDRVNCGKPMAITTNLPLQALKAPPDMQYARLYDRILSVCVPLHFGGGSYRLQQKAVRLDALKQVLAPSG